MDENAICSAIVVEDRFYFTKDFSLTAGLRYDNFYRDTETSDKTFDDITWPIAAN
jgi:hemoglobin/transferrin/lactoferrin receptor protein